VVVAETDPETNQQACRFWNSHGNNRTFILITYFPPTTPVLTYQLACYLNKASMGIYVILNIEYTSSNEKKEKLSGQRAYPRDLKL
jgi:hypothetical protein